MKALTILLTLHLFVSGVLAGTDAGAPVSGRFFNMPVAEVLKVHGQLSGTPIAVPKELKEQKVGLTFTIDKKTKDEALRLIEQVLAEQAGVEIIRAPDGNLVARRIESRK